MLDIIPERLNAASWFIDRNAEEHPESIAVVAEPKGVSYRRLRELTDRAGNVLRRMNCSPGDRVLIALPDSVEFIAAFFGAIKIGAIAVPVSPYLKTNDYSHYVADCGATIAVIHEIAVKAFMPAMANPNKVIVVGGQCESEPSWSCELDSAPPSLSPLSTLADDPAFILYTSGSTAMSKGVLHRHKGMLVASDSFARRVLAIRSDDRTFSVSKLFFGYGLGNAMYFPFSVGASTILDPAKMDINRIAQVLSRHRPTIFYSVPTIFRLVLDEFKQGLKLDFSSVRLVISAGETLPGWIFEQFREIFGLEILDGLGCTEMIQTFISNRPGQVRAGTCGVSVPNYETVLVGEDQRPVADGDVGTLWVKGESAFLGYWNSPELTSRAKIGEWVVTGDRLSRDQDGYFHYVGRTDDAFKVGGMWVSTTQIAAVLEELSAVERAVVLIRGDVTSRKRIIAYVIPRSGTDLSVETLRLHARSKLPLHMIPSAFITLYEFPLNANGKLDRQALEQATDYDTRACGGVSSDSQEASPTEKTIAQIWQALLHIDEVSVSDTFTDLGGDSVTALQCLNRIRQIFDVEIALDVFFSEESSVGHVADLIDRARTGDTAG